VRLAIDDLQSDLARAVAVYGSPNDGVSSFTETL
jgi:hypothetical protein